MSTASGGKGGVLLHTMAVAGNANSGDWSDHVMVAANSLSGPLRRSSRSKGIIGEALRGRYAGNEWVSLSMNTSQIEITSKLHVHCTAI